MLAERGHADLDVVLEVVAPVLLRVLVPFSLLSAVVLNPGFRSHAEREPSLLAQELFLLLLDHLLLLLVVVGIQFAQVGVHRLALGLGMGVELFLVLTVVRVLVTLHTPAVLVLTLRPVRLV